MEELVEIEKDYIQRGWARQVVFSFFELTRKRWSIGTFSLANPAYHPGEKYKRSRDFQARIYKDER
jgi:hypothetical protein